MTTRATSHPARATAAADKGGSRTTGTGEPVLCWWSSNRTASPYGLLLGIAELLGRDRDAEERLRRFALSAQAQYCRGAL